jgi:hypothetical protein
MDECPPSSIFLLSVELGPRGTGSMNDHLILRVLFFKKKLYLDFCCRKELRRHAHTYLTKEIREIMY